MGFSQFGERGEIHKCTDTVLKEIWDGLTGAYQEGVCYSDGMQLVASQACTCGEWDCIFPFCMQTASGFTSDTVSDGASHTICSAGQEQGVQATQHFFLYSFFLLLFYCSITVSAFTPQHFSSTLAKPTSLPCFHPTLVLFMCAL